MTHPSSWQPKQLFKLQDMPFSHTTITQCLALPNIGHYIVINLKFNEKFLALPSRRQINSHSYNVDELLKTISDWK